MTYCDAADSHRITHAAAPGGRALRCATCGRTWPWGGPDGVGDALPLHAPAETFLSREEIIALWEGGR